MNFRLGIAAMLAGAMLSLPVAAHDKDHAEKFGIAYPETLIKGLIREDDVGLFFGYLRESMAAATRGEEPAQSDALNRRAEELKQEMAVRTRVLVDELLRTLESEARRAVREALAEPARQR